jgi:hypothetical protein
MPSFIKFMPAAQWSSPGDEPVLAHNGGQKRPKGHIEESTTSGRLWKRHSCLRVKCRGLALDGSNFHGSIVTPKAHEQLSYNFDVDPDMRSSTGRACGVYCVHKKSRRSPQPRRGPALHSSDVRNRFIVTRRTQARFHLSANLNRPTPETQRSAQCPLAARSGLAESGPQAAFGNRFR